MLTDDEFIVEVETKTGLKLAGTEGSEETGQFGFIAGTQWPFGIATKGMLSANMKNGFEVWKKTKDGKISYKLLNPKSQEESLEQIIDFLNGAMV